MQKKKILIVQNFHWDFIECLKWYWGDQKVSFYRKTQTNFLANQYYRSFLVYEHSTNVFVSLKMFVV